jgi:hypothetical protein
MIGTKKHGAGSKNRLGPFSLHDASRYNLGVPIEIGHAHFPNSSNCGLITEMAHTACGPLFFVHSQIT